jgi:hypothetical protein
MSTMPPTPATTSFNDPIEDEALLTGTSVDAGTSVEDPLTDTTRTWGGEPSGPYGEENR